ncbi:hypothetical protein Z043_110372 [Scleropages formosus]|uniref:Uncharacterized protein n=1 Tax=Scleropages formosus TaxID=113540 RepID=A0A0P7YSZ8_SCLFO|nr:hypothetical protein Z043_110372 [Scleropages formosus]
MKPPAPQGDVLPQLSGHLDSGAVPRLPYRNLAPSSIRSRIQAKTRELRERQARERDRPELRDIDRAFGPELEHGRVATRPSEPSPHGGHQRLQNPRDEPLYTHVGVSRNGRPPSADR